MKRNVVIILLAAMLGFAWLPCVNADETALFSTVAPDALIVLDMSGSMSWNPSGGTEIWGDAACAGPFYSSSGSGHETNCSRQAIAKRTLFGVFDDNQDSEINSSDEGSLNIRFGYMRFVNCTVDDVSNDYNSGCLKLVWPIGSRYSRIYCNGSNQCTITDTAASSINAEDASGGTIIVSALRETKLYLDVHKAADSAKDCRQKFVILITDGMDTFSCGGTGTEYQTTQYQRRRESVLMAKQLADAGYRVFVVGFGATMPDVMKNTLNWMAFYGNTDDPYVLNTGNKYAFDPSQVTTCQESTTDPSSSCTGTDYDCYAETNDPGNLALGGYAFITGSADELRAALKRAVEMIREVNFSFSQASVASSRIQDENYLYEGSFQPITGDPFWLGHLRKFAINSDGTVGGVIWDAGSVLQARNASDRNVKTLIGGSLQEFSTSIDPSYLGITDLAQRDMIVGFFRGESTYNKENWKLGDVFRSNPVSVGTPSYYYTDNIDKSNSTCNAYCTFRNNHVRTSAAGNRLILSGANDGQIRAFKTSDGEEAWSFIPPNFLPKLKNIAHTSHPVSLTHQYYVDGPITVADVWLGSGTGESKSYTDWKTVLIFGEGRGGSSTLWSASSTCDTNFNNVYSVSYPYFCGYYAFNVTTAFTPPSGFPVYMWRLNPNSAHAPYLGEPWSRVYVGRVKIAGNEKWVGFIGGGYNGSDCKSGNCDVRGKGFFVIDLLDGSILWSYTWGNNTGMAYSIPSPPAIVDSDNDGFIDTAYIGDLGNNLWRFNFCLGSQGSSCTAANWSGGMAYEASTGELRPIYTSPSVARDINGHIWIYWGTGDKTDPTAANAQEKFYALKDDTRSGIYYLSNLENITSGVYSDTSKKGWFINLSGTGEKVIAESAVFGGVVYFTTYTPHQGGNLCNQAGDAKLYAVNYMSGSGIFGGGTRSMTLGIGIATAPVLSYNPLNNQPDLYVTISGGGGTGASTIRANLNPPNVANRANMLYWRDTRMQ